jgi:putative transposase
MLPIGTTLTLKFKGLEVDNLRRLKAIGKKLGFQCELRDRPIQGGIVERIF